MKLIIIFVLLFGFTGNAFATGENWSNFCEQEEIPEECLFYISGFLAGHWMTEGLLTTMNKEQYVRTNFCEPEGNIATQTVKITLKYINDNLKFLHKAKEVLIWEALSKAFPCKQNHLKEKWLDKK